MVDWKYLLLAQYPAFLLLSILFLVNFLRVRKNSAVKSMLWVLLFGASLAVSVLLFFLGIHYEYWKLETALKLDVASWIGVVLVIVAAVAHIVHTIEKKHSRKVMAKELEKAAREKDKAVAEAEEAGREAAFQAHLEGRKAERQEAEAERLARAADAADAEAAASELASAANTPIELTLGEPAGAPVDAPVEPPKFDPMTGQPLGGAPEAEKQQ